MQLTPMITFRGMDHSPELESEIQAHIEKLETYYSPLMAIRVLVELVQRHHEHGNRYHVRIDLTVPGDEIVVAHEARLHAAARDLDIERGRKADEADPQRKHARVALREAFDIARRRLQDYARRHRGAVKTPARTPRGRVVRLFPVDGYGYLEGENGHDVYFQRSSVLNNAFDRLMIGSTVAFVEELGEEGPQASTVRLVRPRRELQRAETASPAPSRR